MITSLNALFALGGGLFEFFLVILIIAIVILYIDSEK